jgi:hypothetical protein
MFDFLGTGLSSFWGQRRSDASAEAGGSNARLAHLIGEFEHALEGLESPDALQLHARILRARSKSDLWYLRADVFNLISHARGQQLAQARLESLNALFESSGPRTGPIPL